MGHGAVHIDLPEAPLEIPGDEPWWEVRTSTAESPPIFLQQEETVMCDYSLHHVANRPAQIEDKLVTTQFGNSITRGFARLGPNQV
jgi:hypothetical protein